MIQKDWQKKHKGWTYVSSSLGAFLGVGISTYLHYSLIPGILIAACITAAVVASIPYLGWSFAPDGRRAK